MFAPGVTPITEDLAYEWREGKVVYFHGLLPVFRHAGKTVRSFRLFSSHLIANSSRVSPTIQGTSLKFLSCVLNSVVTPTCLPSNTVGLNRH